MSLSHRVPARTKAAPPKVQRFGLPDLLLVVLVAGVVVTRTPLGALGTYAFDRAFGDASELPSLTAFFSNGRLAAPTLAVAGFVAPPPGEIIGPDQFPEPFRSAARAALVKIPKPAEERLVAEGFPPDAVGVLAWLDGRFAVHRSVEAALEELAIGVEQRQRAVERAVATGDVAPESYATHRRYLPNGVAADADVVVGVLALATALDLAWPVSVPHRVTSPFGERTHPTLGGRRFHNGVDLGVGIGTPVSSAQQGVATVVGESDSSGRYIVVDHGNKVSTSYCHLSETLVKKGAVVAKGELIARSGNTGRSTGPHLHFVVKVGGESVDPERFRRPSL